MKSEGNEPEGGGEEREEARDENEAHDLCVETP